MLPLLVLGGLWSFSFAAAKLAITSGFPGPAYWFWQAAGGAVFLAAASIFMGDPIRMSGPHIRFYLVMAIVGFSLPGLNMAICAPHLPVGTYAVLTTLSPIFTLVISRIAGVERLRLATLAGVLMGLAGTLVLVWPDPEGLAGTEPFWVSVALATPFLYAASNVVAQLMRPPDTGSVALTAAVQGVNAGVLLLVALATESSMLPTSVPPVAYGMLLIQIVIAAAAPLLYIIVVHRSGPVFVSQTSFIMTVLGVIWGLLLFGEHLEWRMLVAAVLVVAGVTIVTRSRPARP